MGDMLELGQYEEKGHKMVGSRAAEVCDVLIAVGNASKYLIDAAVEKGMPRDRIYWFETSDDSVAFVKDQFGGENDSVLVKGSLGMRMKPIVIALEA